jgi:hypothetical protein
MRRILIPFGVMVMVFVIKCGAVESSHQDKDDRAIIRNVMQKSMKGGLTAKVASGKASAEERAELITLFTSLNGTKPPKGDAKAWSEKTAALLAAATANDGAALKKAAICLACHREHK